MDATLSTYSTTRADVFDGTVMPISYIPDWSQVEYQNKSIKFENIPIKDYLAIPAYDSIFLADTSNTSKASLIAHYTYITPYMGSYRLNYKENDGSHNGIDIRAPIGTPVLSIANGVIIRTVETDATGNKFIVIRHEWVLVDGVRQNIYSAYLHLSGITAREWSKVRKWDMIGRVGMSGITTTPHLHIQLDTESAPFHPYWPFTSGESRSAGLSFFDSINAWLGKNNALQYSIHPMDFIKKYLGGVNIPEATAINSLDVLNSAPPAPPTLQTETVAINSPIESIVAGMSFSSEKSTVIGTPPETNTAEYQKNCQKKRFADIPTSSKIASNLYKLIDTKCMLQHISKFDPESTITQKDAIMLIMQYYDITPASGTSHFLDIPLKDIFQGYALVAYRRGILDGNYGFPERLLSREDFVELLVRIGKFEKNPSQIKIYKDTSTMNFKFWYIQDYGFKVRARGGNFYPQTLLTRQWAIELLAQVMIQDERTK